MQTYVPDGRQMKFNLATQSTRQAGSSFKPFVLATAVDQGISVYTGFNGPPSLTINDPACATNGVLWNPHNYADETAGYMNLLEATAHSVNTIYAQLVTSSGRGTSSERRTSWASGPTCRRCARSRSAHRRSTRSR